MVPSIANLRSVSVCRTALITLCMRSISCLRKMFMGDNGPIFCRRALTCMETEWGLKWNMSPPVHMFACIIRLLACLLACLPACLPPCLPACCLSACLSVSMRASLFAFLSASVCLLTCLSACLACLSFRICKMRLFSIMNAPFLDNNSFPSYLVGHVVLGEFLQHVICHSLYKRLACFAAAARTILGLNA